MSGKLRAPKGTVPQLEAALRVIPADRRDSWRVHRVEPGDTFAGIAKRYGTSADLLSSANHDRLPEEGLFAAVPVAYPGERPSTVKTAVKASPRKTAATKASKLSGKKASGVATGPKPAAKPAARAAGKAVQTPGKRTSGA